MNNEAPQKLQTAGGAEREAREWLGKILDACSCVSKNCPHRKKVLSEFAARCANEARLEALEQAASIVLSWSNNLAKEWEKSKVEGIVFDPPSKLAFANDTKRFAAEMLANVYTAIRALKAAPAVAMTESTPQQLRDAEPQG